jgi:hypothetical protein
MMPASREKPNIPCCIQSGIVKRDPSTGPVLRILVLGFVGEWRREGGTARTEALATSTPACILSKEARDSFSASVSSSNWAAAKKSLTALYSAGSTPTITWSTLNLTGAGVVLLPKRVRVRSSGATDSFQVILPDGSITVAVTPPAVPG